MITHNFYIKLNVQYFLILLTKFIKSVGVCTTQSDYLREVVMIILLCLQNMIL